MKWTHFLQGGEGNNRGAWLFMTPIQSLSCKVFYLQGHWVGFAQICGYHHVVSWISHTWDIHETIHQWSSSEGDDMPVQASVTLLSLEKQQYNDWEASELSWSLDNLVIGSVTLCSRRVYHLVSSSRISPLWYSLYPHIQAFSPQFVCICLLTLDHLSLLLIAVSFIQFL